MTQGKKICSIFIATFFALLMVLCSFFVIGSISFTKSGSAEGVEAEEGMEETEHDHEVDGWTVLYQTDFETEETYDSGIIAGGDSVDTVLQLYLSENIDLTSVDITISGYVTLCLNGKVLTGTGESSVITVSSSANFTLCDCQDGLVENTIEVDEEEYTYTSGVITGGMGTTVGEYIYGGGVFIGSNGTFTMIGGTIANNTATYGGGVYASSNANFEMKGGTVSNNNAIGSGSTGGGVCFYGDTFTMTGGIISNNTSGLDAGGVRIYAGKFIMNGGEISNNTAARNGGGVFSHRGSFTIINGTITNNTSISYGGGVYIYGATFTMNGGTISKNVSLSESDELDIDSEDVIGYGGGVAVRGDSSAESVFIMNGGKICDNTARLDDDDLYNGLYIGLSSTFTMIDGYLDGEIYDVNNGITSITGGYFGETAYNSITLEEYLEEGYGFVVLSDDNYFNDEDYISGFSYAVYTVLDEISGITIDNLTLTCNETGYTPTINDAPGDIVVIYTYEGTTSGKGLPTEVGIYTVSATVSAYIDGTEKTCYQQTGITFDVTIEHNFSEEWTSDENGHWHVCENCGEIADYAGHTWGEWTVTNEPTSTEDGEQERTCEVCGETETVVLSATGENVWLILLIVFVILLLFIAMCLIIFSRIKNKNENKSTKS